MKFKLKQQIRDTAQYTYGLASVLKYDADVLRKEANKCDLYNMRRSIQEVNKTLGKIHNIVEEFEHILNLDKTKGP